MLTHLTSRTLSYPHLSGMVWFAFALNARYCSRLHPTALKQNMAACRADGGVVRGTAAAQRRKRGGGGSIASRARATRASSLIAPISAPLQHHLRIENEGTALLALSVARRAKRAAPLRDGREEGRGAATSQRSYHIARGVCSFAA